MRLRQRASSLVPFCAVLILAAILPAHAADDDLVDLLLRKGVISTREAKKVRRAPLNPEQRDGLVEVLHDKGVLSDAELARVTAKTVVTAAPTVAADLIVAAPPGGTQAASGPAAGSKTPQAGYEDGFFVRTADGNWQVKLGGWVASNFLFYEPNTVQNNMETVDRARLTLDVTMYKYFKLRVQNEFGVGSNGLRDAFLAVTPTPAFNIQVGQFKVPFSYEGLLSKKYIDFVERAAVVTSTSNPLRDVGVMAYGTLFDKTLQYQIAGMNGSGQNRSDVDSDKDVVARLVLAPFADVGPAHLKGLSVGGAVAYGYQGPETTKNSDGASSPVKNSIAGTSDPFFNFYQAVARRGYRLRAGTHLAYINGPLGFVGEYIHTSEERRGLDANDHDAPDLDTDGGYVNLTYLLTGETKPLNSRVRPTQPLWSSAGGLGWGAWEAALRYERFHLAHDADSATTSEVENRYQAFVAGLNWYPNEVMRLSLNYVYGNFDERGIGRSPNPNTHSNNAVLTRVQLEF
jgi:phosphate-selective porin OprO and OprP